MHDAWRMMHVAGRTWRQCVGSHTPWVLKRLAHAAVVEDNEDMPRLPQRDSHVPPGVLAAYVLKHRRHKVTTGPLLTARVHSPSWDPEIVGLFPIGFMVTPQLYLFYQPVADAAGHRQKVRRKVIDVDSGTKQDIGCRDRCSGSKREQ